VLTANDSFVIDFDKHTLETRIRNFINSQGNNEYLKQAFDLSKIYAERAVYMQSKIKSLDHWEENIANFQYRIFDKRMLFYHSSAVWRVRDNVMKHMLKPNIALMSCRQVLQSGFQHAFVTDSIADDSSISNKTRERTYIFPRFIYGSTDRQGNLFENSRDDIRHPNFTNEFIKYFYEQVHHPTTDIIAEDIFHYIYAILYSNTYRQKYQEFLKIDFPRIPFTKDYKLFKKVAPLGRQLIELHLLKGEASANPDVKFPAPGDNRVKKREYKESEDRIYVNDTQYFERIKPDIWNYYIGGYQVLDKWLKDRIGRTLSADDIKHYCKIATALAKTITIQKQIDELYPKVEETL